MDKLKPCPFCGGRPILNERCDYTEIFCEDCRAGLRCELRRICSPEYVRVNLRPKVVEAWNRRVYDGAINSTAHAHWIDNADSFLCSRCGYESSNPNNEKCGAYVCPKCHAVMDFGG